MRARVAQWSYPYLVRMHQLPRWVLIGALLGLLAGGIFGPRWVATACLAVVLLFLSWLTYLAWPEGGGSRRIIRAVALVFAAGAIALRAFSG